MPGPGELERMSREAPASPETEKFASEGLTAMKHDAADRKLVFDGKTGELIMAPAGEPVARENIVLDQMYRDGFFADAIAANPELAADVFNPQESDLEYARRRMRELKVA
jgi:hypothetical protein